VITSGCDAGVTLSCVTANQSMNDSSMTVSVTQTMVRNVSTLTTLITTPAATETSATTAEAPVNDIWTVSNPDKNETCILMTAHITVAYNDSMEVISLMILLTAVIRDILLTKTSAFFVIVYPVHWIDIFSLFSICVASLVILQSFAMNLAPSFEVVCMASARHLVFQKDSRNRYLIIISAK